MLNSMKKGLLGLIGALSLGACSGDILGKVPTQYRTGVETAIVAAGANSQELTKTLEAFVNEPEKLEAASFLIKETPRRMHRKHPVDWTWDLAHKDYVEISDAQTVKSKDLIDNVNLAFLAKDRFPWARDLYENNKALFFSGVLPYRLGTASLDQLPGIDGHWRAILLDEKVFNAVKSKHGLKTEFEEVQRKLEELTGAYNAAKNVQEKDKVLTEFTRFVEVDFMAEENLRYFPRGPEEKTLDVFLTPEVKDGKVRRGGRCTDGDNNSRYLHMSVGVPTSSVRFIAWPNGDDNHEVMRILLSSQPFDMSTCIFSDRAQDMKYSPGKVGKVYEETWGTRDSSSELVWNLNEGENLPWYIGFYLRTRSTTDVTDRYGPTQDITISTDKPGQLIYLGVMNNNSDTQLGTATVAVSRADEKGNAKFDKVGSDDLFYIPYTYRAENGNGHATATGLPFVLRRDGSRRDFGSGFDSTIYSQSTLTELEPGKNYEIAGFFVQSGWDVRSRVIGSNTGTADVNLSPYAVYVLRNSEDGRYSRPFALTNGKIEKF